MRKGFESQRGSSESPRLLLANRNHGWLENPLSWLLAGHIAFPHIARQQAGLIPLLPDLA